MRVRFPSPAVSENESNELQNLAAASTSDTLNPNTTEQADCNQVQGNDPNSSLSRQVSAKDFPDLDPSSDAIDITDAPINSRSEFAENMAITTQSDPNLARMIKAWPMLPAAIKAAIMAMVRTMEGKQ